MMNIAVIFIDIDKDHGGIQNSSYLLSKEFAKYAQVFTISENKPKLDDNNIHSTIVKSHGSTFLFKLLSIYSLILLLLRNKIDFILVPQYTFGLACFFAKIFFKAKYGVMVHGAELLPTKKRNPKVLLNKKLCRFVINHADIVFANSNYTKEVFTREISCNNVKIVNPPIEYIANDDTLEQSKSEEKILFSLGRVEDRKGFQNVIKALPKIINNGINVKYILSGTGPYLDNIKKLINELQLGNHIILTGRISDEQKKEYLKICDLFIMPSFYIPYKTTVEGFGIVYLEANSYGKFVIGTNSGGIPDAIVNNKTGFIIRENNIEDISNAIMKFFSPDFKYDPNDCIRWAKDHSINNIAHKYIETISSLL